MKPRSVITIVLPLALAAALGQWWLRAESGGAPAFGERDGGADAGLSGAGAQGAETAPPGVPGEVPGHRGAAERPGVATGSVDHQGREVRVACMTCHATRDANRDLGSGGSTPGEFHQGLVYAHGGQSCLSCHHADDYDSLRLADGRGLAFAEAQRLCAQCHGPQTRDYLNGSHGGMTGYWDRSRGPRARNTCTDCHDPHAPAYPAWTPVFPPRDAAARQQAARAAADHDHE